MSDHVFIGYKFANVVGHTSVVQILTPIIMPKKGTLGKLIQPNIFNYSNGLNDIINQYTSCSHNNDLMEHIFQERQQYAIYLPYLKQLTDVGKLNIYDLIYSGMTLIDEDDVYLGEMFENLRIDDHTTLQELKNNSKKGLKFDLGRTEQIESLRSLVWFIRSKKNLETYPEVQQQIDEYFIQHPLLKELVQDLEYRYQGIIEPILLVDEISVYNYANGAEPPVTERVNRASQVFEEGMKKI